MNVPMEQMIDQIPYHVISELMKGTLILGIIGAIRKTVADRHVDALIQNRIEQHVNLLCRIRIISIYQNICIRINLTEHRSDDIALSLMFFFSDNGTSLHSKFRRTIRGIIIIDIDFSFRKDCSEITDHFGYGQLFVIAWNQHCDFFITHIVSILS